MRCGLKIVLLVVSVTPGYSEEEAEKAAWTECAGFDGYTSGCSGSSHGTATKDDVGACQTYCEDADTITYDSESKECRCLACGAEHKTVYPNPGSRKTTKIYATFKCEDIPPEEAPAEGEGEGEGEGEEPKEKTWTECAGFDGYTSGCSGSSHGTATKDDVGACQTYCEDADTITYNSESKECMCLACGAEHKTVYPNAGGGKTKIYATFKCEDIPPAEEGEGPAETVEGDKTEDGETDEGETDEGKTDEAEFAPRTLARALSNLPKLSNAGVNVMVVSVGAAALLFVVGRMFQRARRHAVVGDSELLSDGSEESALFQQT